MSFVFFPGRQEAEHNFLLCHLCEPIIDVSYHRQALTEAMWLVIARDEHLNTCSDLCTEELAAEFVLDAGTYS